MIQTNERETFEKYREIYKIGGYSGCWSLVLGCRGYDIDGDDSDGRGIFCSLRRPVMEW